jgi:ABC-type polysaccharide/polyol phosphate transport system ATPase subunit
LRDGTIHANEIWKRFRADARRTYLQDELARVFNRIKRRSGGGGWRWVLRDIELLAEPGSSIGLIGANGSGKSTLLKILTQVMYPTAGRLQVVGRVGALIELRAGLHPNLTGRENIFLTGSLMGLGRKEVTRRLDDIVAFSELEGALDRQIKYYSSGMQMRLGFGVAAFMEPDVLLVDEVLAVGDAPFQQRCLDRMREVLNAGTTLIFVSHDLPAVEATCRDGIWLHNGEVRSRGSIRDVLGTYKQWVEADAESAPRIEGPIRVRAHASAGDRHGPIRSGERLDVVLTVESDESFDTMFYIGVSEGTASPVFVVSRVALLSTGETVLRCTIPHVPLPGGHYYVLLGASERGRPRAGARQLLAWQTAGEFDVFGPEIDMVPPAVVRAGPVYVDAGWSVEPGSRNGS